jgi:hypothetical protein
MALSIVRLARSFSYDLMMFVFFPNALKKLFLADIIKTRRNSLTEAQKGGREREG